MFEITVFEVGFCANLIQILIIVVDTAVDTMRVIGPCQEILFNALATDVFFAVFTSDSLSDDGRVVVGTNGTCLFGHDHFVYFLFLCHYKGVGLHFRIENSDVNFLVFSFFSKAFSFFSKAFSFFGRLFLKKPKKPFHFLQSLLL
jgi:hypothetical protein